MSDNRFPNQPRSLLHRLLSQGRPAGQNLSEESAAPSNQAPPTPAQRLEAEAALEEIRGKLAQVANEFANGRLNRAQFSSLYGYHNEQRQLIERILERNPESQAWQTIAHRSNTDFLKNHYRARALTYYIYRRPEFAPLTTQGTVQIFPATLKTLLNDLYAKPPSEVPDIPAAVEVSDNQWLVGVSGLYTVTIVLFVFEPSSQTLREIADLHQDFERANQASLARGVRQEDQFVFPHRALLQANSE